jgi:hypothetical protein
MPSCSCRCCCCSWHSPVTSAHVAIHLALHATHLASHVLQLVVGSAKGFRLMCHDMFTSVPAACRQRRVAVPYAPSLCFTTLTYTSFCSTHLHTSKHRRPRPDTVPLHCVWCSAREQALCTVYQLSHTVLQSMLLISDCCLSLKLIKQDSATACRSPNWLQTQIQPLKAHITESGQLSKLCLLPLLDTLLLMTLGVCPSPQHLS